MERRLRGPEPGRGVDQCVQQLDRGRHAFDIRNCPGSNFVGGVQIGDNFQYKRLVWAGGGAEWG
jgi:hypothetical protein